MRWIVQFVSGLTQFTLYTILFFGIMVGLSYWIALQFFGGEELKAPDLTGLPVVQALEQLQPARIGLIMEAHQPHVQVTAGCIVSQFPSAGATIKAGTPIRVVVSDGSPLVTVPDLRGRSRIDAGIRLRKLGLEDGEVSRVPHPGAPGGTVLTTDPPGGTGVAQGTAVNLMLAAGEGARLQQMPNLAGLTPDEAGEVLASYGLALADAKEEKSEESGIQSGQIYRQLPAAGEPIAPATRIEVVFQPAYSADAEQSTGMGEDGPADTPPPVSLDFGRKPVTDSRLPWEQ